MNKGIAKMDVFAAYDKSDLGTGMLLAEYQEKDRAAVLDAYLASPAMKALANVTRYLSPATSVSVA